jgi:hypothetical protein
MRIVIAETLDDVRLDVDAAHADAIFVLEDPGKPSHGYAMLRHGPAGRWEGVGVAWEALALASLPDPIRVCVRESGGADPTQATLCVRRVALPLLLRVDPLTGSAVVLREIRAPDGSRIGVARKRAAAAPTFPPDPPPAAQKREGAKV